MSGAVKTVGVRVIGVLLIHAALQLLWASQSGPPMTGRTGSDGRPAMFVIGACSLTVFTLAGWLLLSRTSKVTSWAPLRRSSTPLAAGLSVAALAVAALTLTECGEYLVTTAVQAPIFSPAGVDWPQVLLGPVCIGYSARIGACFVLILAAPRLDTWFRLIDARDDAASALTGIGSP